MYFLIARGCCARCGADRSGTNGSAIRAWAVFGPHRLDKHALAPKRLVPMQISRVRSLRRSTAFPAPSQMDTSAPCSAPHLLPFFVHDRKAYTRLNVLEGGSSLSGATARLVCYIPRNENTAGCPAGRHIAYLASEKKTSSLNALRRLLGMSHRAPYLNKIDLWQSSRRSLVSGSG